MPAAYRIEKYKNIYKAQWDACVQMSKNGTFLHYRDFVEYHSERFKDFSLLVFDGEKVIAILPANRVGETVFSHQGLTYGGLVYSPKVKLAEIIKMLQQILKFLNENGIKKLHFKSIPSIYHSQPAQEAEYALFTAGAKLSRRDAGFVNDLHLNEVSKDRQKKFRKIEKSGVLEVRKDNDFSIFWDEILIPKLSEKYNANPVHSLNEIINLFKKFPENIVQYNVWHQGNIVAGITLFSSGSVIKSQYGAANSVGENLRALDFLYINLINEYKGVARYLDMGTVKNDNPGLAQQKQELGGRLYLQDFYEVDTENYNVFDTM